MKKFHEIKSDETFDYGGKALGLLWLQTKGYNVPTFSLISYHKIDEWMKNSGIKDSVSFNQNKQHLKHQITNFLDTTPDSDWNDVAIRSSAKDEDGVGDSFAGIHESILNVKSKIEAADAILKVLSSGFSSVAQSYRQSRLIFGYGMGVIIQKMITPMYAGVSFGMNPQTGCARSVWISLSSGLADKLVSGHTQGDEYLFENGKLNLISSNTQIKIREEVLKDLALLTLKISEQKSHPQDIEWAYDGEKIWLLQVRPITILKENETLNKTVFDNSNIQESYCGVTTPLTFTYASMAYERVYRQLMRLMLMSESEIEKARWNLQNLLGLVNGRVYYNINNWYFGLLYMPSFGKRKKEMEDMMGLESPVDFIQGQKFSFLEKVKKIPQMIKLMIVMIYRFSQMNRLVNDFDRWFWRLYNDVQIQNVYKLSEFEIFEKIRYTQDVFMEKWGIPVLNDTKVMMDMGSVKRLLEKYHFVGELKSIMYGAEIESVRPTLEIHKLSKEFGSTLELKYLLFEKKSFELLKILEIFYEPLFDSIQKFLYNYGDRCIGELKLETITMRQDPEILFSIIRNFIQSGLNLKEEIFQPHTNDEVFSEVISKMTKFDKFRFKIKVRALKDSIAAREKLRMHRTRSFGLSRVLYLALGEKWKSRKILNHARDIFYLTHSEIFDIGSGKATTSNWIDLIEIRKNDFMRFKEQKPPAQVHLTFPPIIYKNMNPNANQDAIINGDNQWSGLAAAQGVCEGEVIFINESQNIPELRGKILLAERTDPGWTPLFTMVKGVIVEKGSMLSHSAIIAREMGIPSVISVKNITQLLQTGDYIRLDGDRGVIELLKSAQDSRQNNKNVSSFLESRV